MAGNTDVDICARALVCIGLKPINSLAGDDDKVTTCRIIYPMVKEEVLSRYPWRFTMVKKQLGRLLETPIGEWKYAYQLPSDRLGGPLAVFNTSDPDAIPVKHYDIYQDHLYTNEEKVWIDYQADQSEAKFPPYVRTLMIYVTAARLAEPLTDDGGKADKWDTMAYGSTAEKQQGGYFELAKNIDSRQRPSQQISGDFSLVDVRG